MRKILLAAAIVVSAAACSNDKDVEERVRFVAAGMQAIAPKDLGDGVTLTSAAAEGKTLVLAFRGSGASDPNAPAQLRQVACKDGGYRRLIDQGAAIRFELTTFDGSQSTPVIVANCDA